jgi:hypothetical protein
LTVSKDCDIVSYREEMEGAAMTDREMKIIVVSSDILPSLAEIEAELAEVEGEVVEGAIEVYDNSSRQIVEQGPPGSLIWGNNLYHQHILVGDTYEPMPGSEKKQPPMSLNERRRAGLIPEPERRDSRGRLIPPKPRLPELPG